MSDWTGHVRAGVKAGEFVLSMKRTREAAKILARRMAQMEATWEPHDWSDFR